MNNLTPQGKKKESLDMTRKIVFLFMFSLLVSISLVYLGFAKENKEPKNKQGLQKTTSDDAYAYIDINQILRWISNNGDGSYDPNTGIAGLYWPKGTSNTAVYEDGIVYGGLVSGGELAAGVKQLRLVGSTYRHPFQAGPIVGVQNGRPVGDDPTLVKNRIYKIEKGFHQYASSDPAKYTALKNDYREWPGDQGAPYIDMNGDGIFQPPVLDANDNLSSGDAPLFIGDQVLYHVSNDANPTRTNFVYGSDPMGMELHRLLWGYALSGVMGNTWFEKWTLINKGAYTIDSLYLAYWSDTDLGDGNDDFSGCDTVLQLGYTYGGEAIDGVYGPSPADGYVLLQGPLFPSANDTAIFTWGGKGSGVDTVGFYFNKRAGFRNQKMSAYSYYINGSSVYRDPQFNTTGALEFYRYMKGFIWNGDPFVDPTTNQPTKYTLAGDPTTQPPTGWVDGKAAKMGDRRHVMSCGPFTMAPADTQEIVIGFNIAQGGDYLGSITALKDASRVLHTVYGLHFNLPSPPPAPVAKVSDLPGKIVLDWSNPANYPLTEASQVTIQGTTYYFEGYNVYQLPSPTASLSAAKKLTTFDLKNGITVVQNDVFDSKLGITMKQVSQAGTDNGLQRYFVVDQDYLNGGPLVKGKHYYFAVTSYSVNPTPPFGTQDLENPFSSATIYMAIPQDASPGSQVTGDPLQEIEMIPIAGTATPYVSAKIIDPKQLKGGNYKVVFNAPDTSDVIYYSFADYATPLDTLVAQPNVKQWSVVHETNNATVINKSTYFSTPASGGGAAPVAEGIQFYVSGLPQFDQDHVVKEAVYAPSANLNLQPYASNTLFGVTFMNDQAIAPTTAMMDGLFLGSGGRIGQEAWKDTFKVVIRFADPNDTINQVGWSKGYCYLLHAYRAAGASGYPVHVDPTNDSVHSDNWWYYRTSASGYLYDGFYSSALQIWDITNPAAPRQLEWAFWQVDSLTGPLQQVICTAADSIVRDYRGGGDQTWSTPRYFYLAAGDTLTYNKFIRNPDYKHRFSFPTVSGYRQGMFTIINSPYRTTPDTLFMRPYHLGFFDALAQDANSVSMDYDGQGPGMMKGMYSFNYVVRNVGNPAWRNHDSMVIYPNRPLTTSTVFHIDPADLPVAAVTGDNSLAKDQVKMVNVYPNPYFGANAYETNKYQRFVTFTHLPQIAKIRIFNLAGTHVVTLKKNDASQFYNWDLRNRFGLPVASGMYIIYIDMGSLGTKILKLGVIMEAQYLDRI